jgi:hypothetical protein
VASDTVAQDASRLLERTRKEQSLPPVISDLGTLRLIAARVDTETTLAAKAS